MYMSLPPHLNVASSKTTISRSVVVQLKGPIGCHLSTKLEQSAFHLWLEVMHGWRFYDHQCYHS